MRAGFPRFGLPQFAGRLVDADSQWSITVVDDHDHRQVINADWLSTLPRTDQTSDFHCVTTWSTASLQWSGFRFSDVLKKLSSAGLHVKDASWLLTRSLDGFQARLPLSDAIADDVLLADHLDGEPLGVRHGAPLRLVAPRHYGYKSPKHLRELRLASSAADFESVMPLPFMEHPRARVDLEERGVLPGRLLRVLYRPLIKGTVRRFAISAAPQQH